MNYRQYHDILVYWANQNIFLELPGSASQTAILGLTIACATVKQPQWSLEQNMQWGVMPQICSDAIMPAFIK